MNIALRAFHDLLDKRIIVDGVPVSCYVRVPEDVKLPVVVLRAFKNEEFPHAYEEEIFIEENGKKIIDAIDIVDIESYVINILIYAKSPAERDKIYSQAYDLIKKAIYGHHTLCHKYNNGICQETGRECDARTVVNRFSVRGACPYAEISDKDDPHYRGPISFFTPYNIIMVRFKEWKHDEAPEYYPRVFSSSLEVYVDVESKTRQKAIPFKHVKLNMEGIE